jgi:hypothetical protein
MFLLEIFLLSIGHGFISTFIEQLKLLNQLFSHILCELFLVSFPLPVCLSLLLLFELLLLLLLLIKLDHCLIFHGGSNVIARLN